MGPAELTFAVFGTICGVFGCLNFFFNRSRLKKALYSCLRKCFRKRGGADNPDGADVERGNDNASAALLGVQRSADVGFVSRRESHDISGTIMVDKNALFDELSRKFPAANYTRFCDKMGVSYNEAKSTLTRYKEDYNVALRDLLFQWDQRMNGVTRKQLEDALDKADVSGLRLIVTEHYEKGNPVLNKIFRKDLESTPEYEALVHDHFLEILQQSTPKKSDREVKEEVCHDLTERGYPGLSEKVKSYPSS